MGLQYGLRPAAGTHAQTDEYTCGGKPAAPVAQQLEQLAGLVSDRAAKVAEVTAIKLQPLYIGGGRDDCAASAPEEAWPEHFSTMRSRLQQIQNYLADIEYHINAVGT